MTEAHEAAHGARTAEVLRSAFWRSKDFCAAAGEGFDEQTMPLRLAVMLTPLDPELPQRDLGGRLGYCTFFAGAPSRQADSGCRHLASAGCAYLRSVPMSTMSPQDVADLDEQHFERWRSLHDERRFRVEQLAS